MGAGFGAAPAAAPASFSAPVSGGLDDLFDLGGGVSMPMGAYSPPKTVSWLPGTRSFFLKVDNQQGFNFLNN